MTDEQTPAAGPLTADDELIERSLRTIHVYDAVRYLRDALSATTARLIGYDWNADSEAITRQQGDAFAAADKVFADLNAAVDAHPDIDLPECASCGGTGKIEEAARTEGANQHSACVRDCDECDGCGFAPGDPDEEGPHAAPPASSSSVVQGDVMKQAITPGPLSVLAFHCESARLVPLLRKEAERLGKGIPTDRPGLHKDIWTAAEIIEQAEEAFAFKQKMDALAPAPAEASGSEREESAGDMLSRLGMDGKLWAEGFQKTALTLGYPEMDDGWLLGWFCNAIMAGYDHARRKYDPEILAHFRPQPSGETEALRVLLDNLVIAQSLSRELREQATNQARSYLYNTRPTQPDTGKVEASGSELNPATADLVDRFAAELKSKLAKAEAKYGYAADWLKTDWQDELNESLAEHIQKGDPRDVAAYCAFAWHHGWSTSDVAGHIAPKFHFQASRERIAKCIRRAVGDAWIGECQAEVAADAVLNLRPQPSGETREAVRLALEDSDALERLSEEADDNQWPDWAATMRQAASRIRRLALTRPAPVASGGQHSSGEGAAWTWLNGHVECDPADRDYSADEMVDAFMAGAGRYDRWSKALERIAGEHQHRSGYCQTDITVEPALTAEEAQTVARDALSGTPVQSTAPVAETAGEAVGVVSGCARADLYTADLPTGTLLYAAPVPAQDDDRLRIPAKWFEVAEYATERGLAVHESNIRLEEFRRVVSPEALAALQEAGEVE